jgi:hypothetical protein
MRNEERGAQDAKTFNLKGHIPLARSTETAWHMNAYCFVVTRPSSRVPRPGSL